MGIPLEIQNFLFFLKGSIQINVRNAFLLKAFCQHFQIAFVPFLIIIRHVLIIQTVFIGRHHEIKGTALLLHIVLDEFQIMKDGVHFSFRKQIGPLIIGCGSTEIQPIIFSQNHLICCTALDYILSQQSVCRNPILPQSEMILKISSHFT